MLKRNKNNKKFDNKSSKLLQVALLFKNTNEMCYVLYNK